MSLLLPECVLSKMSCHCCNQSVFCLNVMSLLSPECVLSKCHVMSLLSPECVLSKCHVIAVTRVSGACQDLANHLVGDPRNHSHRSSPAPHLEDLRHDPRPSRVCQV